MSSPHRLVYKVHNANELYGQGSSPNEKNRLPILPGVPDYWEIFLLNAQNTAIPIEFCIP